MSHGVLKVNINHFSTFWVSPAKTFVYHVSMTFKNDSFKKQRKSCVKIIFIFFFCIFSLCCDRSQSAYKFCRPAAKLRPAVNNSAITINLARACSRINCLCKRIKIYFQNFGLWFCKLDAKMRQSNIMRK
jgi:hypothetical protein